MSLYYSRMIAFFLLVNIAIIASFIQTSTLETAQSNLFEAKNWVQSSMEPQLSSRQSSSTFNGTEGSAWSDCEKLYEESEARLARVGSREATDADVLVWLSGVMTNHRSCLDGLAEKGVNVTQAHAVAHKLTASLEEALAFYDHRKKGAPSEERSPDNQSLIGGGLLASWNPATSKADFVVAKDGSGTHTTINAAVAALARMGRHRPPRAVVYVKAGVYSEKVEIGQKMRNVMFVGDGIGKTIVTGSRNVRDGATTLNSATFGVSGDGFWARDMTFENTAGPEKHQAVALRVSSDLAVFYRCSAEGFQDTLYAHSLRQFYRDCRISGTVDFIFGNAAAVLQNCDILVRRPMPHQRNMITAQGRDYPHQTTGFSIHASRIRAASELEPLRSSFRSFLGRPWKRYSRTVFMRTDMDGIVDPKGWTEWRGSYALSTLFYGEYMNRGDGAVTAQRVRWPGFHVLRSDQEAGSFATGSFIQGGAWIPATGIPVWLGV